MMTALTIRELRQHWPAAEKALELEEEILITRDGKPVAKLVKLPTTVKRRALFNPRTHVQKMTRILGGKVLPSLDQSLAERRSDRRSS